MVDTVPMVALAEQVVLVELCLSQVWDKSVLFVLVGRAVAVEVGD